MAVFGTYYRVNTRARPMWIATVDPAGAARPRKTTHWVGSPPSLFGDTSQRSLAGWPGVVVLMDESDGRYLFRFAADGKEVGDTWHQTIEDAKDQADFEYEDLLGEWREVPPEVGDPVALALGLPTSEFR